MVCYIVPTAAALAVHVLRNSREGLRENKHYHWLNLLLFGAVIFGVVDHLWNGELFLTGENTAADLALGATITLTIFVAWGLTTAADQTKAHKPAPTT